MGEAGGGHRGTCDVIPSRQVPVKPRRRFAALICGVFPEHLRFLFLERPPRPFSVLFKELNCYEILFMLSRFRAFAMGFVFWCFVLQYSFFEAEADS